MTTKKHLLEPILYVIESHINDKTTIQNLIDVLDLCIYSKCLSTILLSVNNTDYEAREIKQKINNELKKIINNICENNENDNFLICYNSNVLKKYIRDEFFTSFAIPEKLDRSNDAFINTCLDNRIDPEINHLYSLNLLSRYQNRHLYLKKYINDWLQKYVNEEIRHLLNKKNTPEQRTKWINFIDRNTAYVCNPKFPRNFDYDLLCNYLLTNYPDQYYRIFIKTARIIEKHIYAASNEAEIKYYKKGFEHLTPVWFCEKKYKYDFTIYLDDKENIFGMTFEEYSKLLNGVNSKGMDNLVLKSRLSCGLTEHQENIIKQINDSWYLLGKNTYSSIADYYVNNFNIEDGIFEYLKLMSNNLENIDNRKAYEGIIDIFKGSNKFSNQANNIIVYNSGKNKYAIKDFKNIKVLYIKYNDEELLNKIVYKINSFKRHPLILYKFNILYIFFRENEFHILDDVIKDLK